MLEIIKQHEDSHEGNNCLIKDAIILFVVHEKCVVQIIRRYIGWCDHGMDFRSRREFDNRPDAEKYFKKLVQKECDR